MSKDATKYLKDVKSLFPVFQKEEKLYFQKFKLTVQKETEDHELTYQDCIDKFGSPKEIIIDYYEEMDSNKLLKRIQNQHFFRKTFYILSCSIIIVSLVACALIYKSYLEVQENHATGLEITTEIIE